jgi:hypothetical protein
MVEAETKEEAEDAVEREDWSYDFDCEDGETFEL